MRTRTVCHFSLFPWIIATALLCAAGCGGLTGRTAVQGTPPVVSATGLAYAQRYAAVDPSGQFLLVANSGDSTLDCFRIDPDSLGLTLLSGRTGVPSGSSTSFYPSSLAVTGTMR